MRSWFGFYHFRNLQYKGTYRLRRAYFGLQSADASFPHMYRYTLQWYNGSIAHYVKSFVISQPPFCGYLNFVVHVTLCGVADFDDNIYAYCKRNTLHRRKKPRKITLAKIAQPAFRNVTNLPSLPVTVSCPDQHKVLQFLACDAFSACCLDHDVIAASGDAKVTGGQDAEAVCSGEASVKTFFPCRNDLKRVAYSVVCDHRRDCPDNSDEDFCVFPPCSAPSQYKCANGQCVPFRQRCDDYVQCVDESDETDCVSKTYGNTNNCVEDSQRPPLLADFDGRGFIIYRRPAKRRKCPDTHVACPGSNFYCVPVYVRCNGIWDCPSHEDEHDCDSYRCPGFYRCRGLISTCLHLDHVCDGVPQCPQHDDELFCNVTCPVHCACLGHAFTCSGDFHVEEYSSLRYLDAGDSGMKPERFSDNLLLVYLRLSHCGLTRFTNLSLLNLLSLDLSDNRLSAVSVAELSRLTNLQNLSLARNPLLELFSGNFSAVSLDVVLHLDLAGVQLPELDVGNSLPFPRLRSLNLSRGGVSRLIGDGFQSLTSLVTLDLRHCPMAAFVRGYCDGLAHLRAVFADNYKLCCPANLPGGFNVDNCRAPFDEVSSCDALLRSDVYRVCLSVLAALALGGNLGCFCLRAFALAGRGKTGFNVFVTHLCVSDFMMGVYLAMIGVADRVYLRVYLWEDLTWRHGAACQVAGVLALLSSEVSALVICLITLDRFLVIRFPFSRLRFSPFSAQIASFLTWIAGAALVSVPLLPTTSHWHFYSKTGICVPLPVTKNDDEGRHYSFGVMILLNLVLFLLIAVGQISVYMSMASNAMSSSDSTRKARDLVVARRLFAVVVSDFLCWFPLGMLGVLAARGVPVAGEVNVAMAIFVLPLNSALNPFLYTVNMILEKRRRVEEEKLLKVIMDSNFNDDCCVNPLSAKDESRRPEK